MKNPLMQSKMVIEGPNKFLQVLDTLHKNSFEGVCWINAQNLIVYINPAFLELTGKTIEDLMGKTGTVLKFSTSRLKFMGHPIQAVTSDQERPKEAAQLFWVTPLNAHFEMKLSYESCHFEGENYQVIRLCRIEKIAEKEVREMQLQMERQQNLLDSSLQATFLLGPDYEILGYNKRAKELVLLFNGLDIIHFKNLMELGFPNSIRNFTNYFQTALKGIRLTYEHQIFYPVTMKEAWFQSYFIPICEKHSNTVSAISFSLLDISMKKGVELRLKHSENRLNAIFENTSQAIFMIDASMMLVNMNQQAEQLSPFFWGKAIQKGGMIGLSTSGFSELFAVKMEEFRANGKLRFTYHTKISHEIRWFECWLYPVPEPQGTLLGTALVIMDITERLQKISKLRQSHRQIGNLRNALFSSSIVTLLDSNGKILWANPQFLTISGYNTDELIGKRHDFLQMNHQQKDLFQNLNESLDSGHIWRGEVCYRGKANYPFWLDLTVVPVKNRKGKVIRFFSIGNDITERKRAVEEMLNTNYKLVKTNHELDKFVYSASHQLRAPLLSINGLIALIRMENLEMPLKLQEYLNMILASVSKMDDTILEINNYANNLNEPIERDLIDLESLIHTVLGELSGMTIIGKLHISVTVEAHVHFYSDAKRLKNILKNIIHNAIKYQSPTHEHPFVRIHAKTDELQAFIAVEDNGIGIPKEHVGDIFNMFFRANDMTTGSGLGLYVVKETLETLRGRVIVDSDTRTGSVFSLFIPNMIYDLE